MPCLLKRHTANATWDALTSVTNPLQRFNGCIQYYGRWFLWYPAAASDIQRTTVRRAFLMGARIRENFQTWNDTDWGPQALLSFKPLCAEKWDTIWTLKLFFWYWKKRKPRKYIIAKINFRLNCMHGWQYVKPLRNTHQTETWELQRTNLSWKKKKLPLFKK